MVDIVKQKQGMYRANFNFEETELTYSFDNSRTRTGSSVPYHKIPGRVSYRKFKMWWLIYVTVFLLAAWVVAALNYSAANDLENLAIVSYGLLLLFLCVCLIALVRRHNGMTSLAMDPLLFILHDGQQDAILQEIMRRRREAMKKKLAVIDFNRPYFEEARKFRWLWEEEIISEQEYRSARQKIAALRDKAGMVTSAPGRMN